MNQRKSIIAAVSGTTLEYYDFMLYMHFLFILSPLFFPTDNLVVARMIGMATFALGFVMRPIGGLVFGHLGDRFGRKRALALSIILISLPTFIIGVLPTYAQIGLLAPVILLTCRLLQSFCLGGEATGATVFLVEHAKRGYEGRIGSLLNVGGELGGILGTSLGVIFTLAFMPEWGWRVPFIMGGLFGWIGFYIRSRTSETPAFRQAQQQKSLVLRPFMQVLKRDKANTLCIDQFVKKDITSWQW